MVLTIAVQVFFRYILGHPLTWTEELATWLFAFVIFIGATVSIRHDEAPALRVVVDRLPAPAALTLDTVTEVLAFAISLAILWNGALASQAMMSALTPAMKVPSGIPLIILPVAGLGLSVHYTAKIARRASGSNAVLRLVAGGLVAAPITHLKIETLARAVVPFLLTILVDLALVCIFPQLSLWLPSLFHH
jgi:TRAP-type C4-dicarboxylate transport system permease small subunit